MQINSVLLQLAINILGHDNDHNATQTKKTRPIQCFEKQLTIYSMVRQMATKPRIIHCQDKTALAPRQ
jgi:hypothetical protein